MKAQVSIIMPVFNVEPYVEHALTSALDQTYPNFEIVIVDDCSTDESAAVVHDVLAKRTEEERQKVSFISHDSNRGYGAVTNTARSRATGEYLWFFDADDTAHPDMLEKLHDAISQQNADIAIARMATLDVVSGSTGIIDQWVPKSGLCTGKEAVRRFARAELQAFQANKLISTQLWEGITSPDNTYADMTVIPRLLRRAERIAFVDEPLYHYMIRSSSVTGSLRETVWDLTKIPAFVNPVIDQSAAPTEAKRLRRQFVYRHVYWPMLHKAAAAEEESELGREVTAWVRGHARWRDLMRLAAEGRFSIFVTIALAKASPSIHRRVFQRYKRGMA